MYYHDDLQIAYLTPPRTASRSVAAMLLAHGFRKAGDHHQILPALVGARAKVIYCTVRNHFDTLVSWWSEEGKKVWQVDVKHFTIWFYQWFLKGSAGCLSYMDDRFSDAHNPSRFAPKMTMWHRWTQHATHIIRYESLQEDLERELPFEVGALPWITDEGAREGRDYRKYYDPDMVKCVNAIFGQEIAECGYEF